MLSIFASYRSTTSYWEILIYLAILGPLVLWRLWNRKETAKIVVEYALLISMYSENGNLNSISKGKLGEYKYNLLITSPRRSVSEDGPHQYGKFGKDYQTEVAQQMVNNTISMSNNGKIIMALQLPFKSNFHMLCMGVPDSASPDTRAKLYDSNNLEKVTLEGDFPDYFTVLTRKGDRIELLEIVDPTIMAFLVDFCKHEDWELFEDYLYFTENNIAPRSELRDDNTSLIKDIQVFVEKVLPVLQRMQQVVPAKQG